MSKLAVQTPSTVIPALRYLNAPAAIEWLCNVIGFTRHTLNGGMIMLGSQKDDEHAGRFKSPAETEGVETSGVYIVVTDVEAVHARAIAAGATIIRPLQDTTYGSREFAVKDPEGHSWSLGNYDPWAAH